MTRALFWMWRPGMAIKTTAIDFIFLHQNIGGLVAGDVVRFTGDFISIIPNMADMNLFQIKAITVNEVIINMKTSTATESIKFLASSDEFSLSRIRISYHY
ncbi:hypothetical protein NLM65_26120 [Klebsiella variicola]|uniref:hypothetical protein n=1 Tax=Klebsiella variicola TaxID=244366 RepID=UPI0020B6622D|nr:hypothetical protein [Klebsiella variicola]MCP3439045.1 hypothetical protein [Klebsiella variicola]